MWGRWGGPRRWTPPPSSIGAGDCVRIALCHTPPRARCCCDKLGIGFTLHPYDYDPDAPRVGLAAAEALGFEPGQVFKTLMAELDGKPVCAVVPSDSEMSMKKLAATLGGKQRQ